MRYSPVQSNQNITAAQLNLLADDATGGANLLAHQMLGLFALGTNPTNGKTITLTINSVAITITFVSTIGSTAGNVLIAGTAAGTVANLLNLLANPQITNANQVALASANQTLFSYLDFDQSGTNLSVCPVNNLTYAPLTSFSAATNVTSGTWTANTMALYVEDGICSINGTQVYFTGGVTPTVTAPVSHPRIDLLTIDNTGTLAWVTGVEGASPTTPAYPNNKLVICELWNVVDETQLLDNLNQAAAQGYIYNDTRPFLQSPINFASISDSIVPSTASTYNLGSSLLPWNNVYAGEFFGSGAGLTNVPISSITNVFVASEAISALSAVSIRGYNSTDSGVQFDSGGTGSATGANGTVNNIAVTIGANNNRLLVVTVSTGNSNGAFSITYNGVSPTGTLMSNVGVVSTSGCWTFYWLNPTTGTHNLAVTIGNTNGLTYGVGYLSLYNINQAGPTTTSSPGGGTPATAASVTTTVAGSCVIKVSGGSGTVSDGAAVNPQSTSNTYISWSDQAMATGASFSLSRATGAGANGAWEWAPATTQTGIGVGKASSLYPIYRFLNYIGIALGSAAVGANVTVYLVGILTGLSGLTAGADYYLNDTNGTMGTSAGTNTRKVGIALTSTSILLTNNF